MLENSIANVFLVAAILAISLPLQAGAIDSSTRLNRDGAPTGTATAQAATSGATQASAASAQSAQPAAQGASDASIFDSIKPTFPESPQPGATPPGAAPAAGADEIVGGPTGLNFLDINNSTFGKLELTMTASQSPNVSIDKIHVVADGLDLKGGNLKAMALDVQGGHFQDFIFDQLSVRTQQEMHFDSDVFLNQRVLQFETPALADVSATVSQDSLNAWLAAPSTLDRLSVTASKKVSAIASLFGANAANLGVKLSEASCTLEKNSRVTIAITANVGMGGIGLPIPLGLDAKLGLQDGWIGVSDTHLNSNGHEISPQISQMLVSKINGMAEWGKKNDDIHFEFTDLKVVPNKQFVLKGTATIARLRFAAKKP